MAHVRWRSGLRHLRRRPVEGAPDAGRASARPRHRQGRPLADGDPARGRRGGWRRLLAGSDRTCTYHPAAGREPAGRPGGRIFIHTAPNATVYELTYRIHRRARPGRSRRWPEDPRNAYERAMHVNEQTVGSLRRTLRQAGFDRASVKPGRWVHTDFIAEERPRRLYRALARVPGARRLAVFDLFATASRPSLR